MAELNDFLALLMGAPDEARLTAQAMAQKLRGQQDVATMSSLGDARSQAIGQQAAAQAKQGQDLLEKAGVARLHYGEEASKLKQTLQAQKDAAAMGRLQDANSLKLALAEMRAATAGNKPEDDEKKAALKDLQAFTKSINPLLQSSRSGIGSSGIVNLRGQRVLRELGTTNPEDLDKLPPQQILGATQGVASMVNGGYAPAISAMHELSPKTIGMTAAQLSGYLQNEPKRSGQAKYLQMLIGIIERENKQAKSVQAKNFFTQLNAFPRVSERHPDKVKRAAESLGIHDYLDDNLDPKPGVLEALNQGKLPEEMQASTPSADIDELMKKYGGK